MGEYGTLDYTPLKPFCPVCGIEFDTLREFKDHKETEEHRIKWLERQYRTARFTYLKDKYGFKIDVITANSKIVYSPDNYTVEVITDDAHQDANCNGTSEHKDAVFQFTLRVFHDGTVPFLLRSVDLLNNVRLVESGTQIHVKDLFQVFNSKSQIIFGPGKRYEIGCEVIPGSIVRALHIPILLEFYPIPSAFGRRVEKEEENGVQPFYIGKTIEIKGASYSVRTFENFVEGVYPESSQEAMLERERDLHKYHIPAYFHTLAYNNHPTEIRRKMNISDNLQSKNHVNFFRTLLWLEELQQELDIQYYSKKNVTLGFSRAYQGAGVRLVELKEEGLAENRPCVMVKDQVFVCSSVEALSSEHPKWFQGFVHRIENTSIFLGFDQFQFMQKFDESTRVNVEFTINRHPLRVSHRAIDLCLEHRLHSYLFPPPDYNDYKPDSSLPPITPYDSNITNNTEQLQAVRHIVGGTSGNAPYIVFGPPGTGKTVTVVEAIKQVLYRIERSHVLACAPSNTAADVIAERLLEHFSDKHVLRLYASSRASYASKLPPKLRLASNLETGSAVFDSKTEIMKKRVVVCTLITAAKLAGACFPDDHFTHIILDEVGHATECEALVGVGGLLSPGGHLILAGDPHQLGPVIRSMQAMSGGAIFPKTGLDKSFLERLMEIPRYRKVGGNFNPRYVTKLVKNYRSHEAILKVPNDLFYNSELQAKGKPSLVNYLSTWPHLPAKNFPIIVESVEGEDRMEKRSPSYHNPKEVECVLSYLSKLFGGQPEVKPAEIGIITPYRLQVEKLRTSIERKFPSQFAQMKIGSVEDFQGEERKVIIISTVRATTSHIAKDHLFKLGFLSNPKRFNVAVTRAQCLVILVGCARVLMMDRNWKCLIDYVVGKGGYVGKKARAPKDNVEDIIKKMGELDIRPTVGRSISERQMVELPSMPCN